MPIIIICVVIICVTMYFFVNIKLTKEKLIRKFSGEYYDYKDFDFEDLKYIKKYWEVKSKRENPKYEIDDFTWNDLDMDYLFSQMNINQSSIGEACLYARLRSVNFNQDELEFFSKTVDFMDKNKDIKVKSLLHLSDLGKELDSNLHEYIYEINKKPLENINLYYVLMALPIISIISCFFVKIGFVFLFFTFFLNTIVYFKNKIKIEANLNSLKYISKLVHCANRLSKVDFGDLGLNSQINLALAKLKKVGYLGSSIMVKSMNEMDIIFQYIKIIFMWDFIMYNKAIKLISGNSKEFHDIYQLVGNLDSAISILEYRKTLEFYSIPKFENIDNIVCIDIYNPILTKPVYNSLDWKKNSIITGSNATGKSTFVKSMAICGICAQNIHMVFAREYRSKMSFIITSMAIKDKIYNGESYFVAEIRSINRILDLLNDEIRIVCFIDEILKGTNTIERISASAAILDWLYKKNCLAMIASHDIELTEILKFKYDNYHFREQILDDSIFFDYKIHNGATTSRNAINLLKFMNYDSEIVDKASIMAENFEGEKKWSLI